MTQDVLITPESGIIEFSNNATVSASIVLDSANSRLKDRASLCQYITFRD